MADHFDQCISCCYRYFIPSQVVCLSNSSYAQNPERPVVAPLFIPKSEVGAQLSVGCTLVRGQTPVSFTWRKNNEVISDSRVTVVDPKEGMSSLKLVNLSQSDRGSYSCTAKNSFGEDTKTAELDLSGMFVAITFLNGPNYDCSCFNSTHIMDQRTRRHLGPGRSSSTRLM